MDSNVWQYFTVRIITTKMPVNAKKSLTLDAIELPTISAHWKNAKKSAVDTCVVHVIPISEYGNIVG